MKEYLLTADGLQFETWKRGESLAQARKAFWDGLSEAQKDKVSSIECIDEREIAKSNGSVWKMR